MNDASPTLLSLGRIVVGVGVLGLGVQNLIAADVLMELQPLPSWVPGRPLWASATGVLLVVAAVGLISGLRVRFSAAALALALTLWCVLVNLPQLLAHFGNGGVWTSTVEIFALAGGVWALASLAPAEARLPDVWNARLDRATALGRTCFAATLPVFGVLHFIYHDYVASVIPAWIPAHQFWAYATGIALAAAGLSLLSGVLARLPALLFGIMLGTWVLILHVPRVAADSANRRGWTSLFVTVALCGAAFVIAASLARSSAKARALSIAARRVSIGS